jgi:gliding motility-associated-like protein
LRSIITHVNGTYSVTVTNQFGCTGTSQGFTTDVKNVPFAAYTIYTPVAGRPDTIIHFYDSSFVLSPAHIDSVYWWFGDGDTSVLFNPIHTYFVDGIYKVKMVVVTADGCRDTIAGDYLIESIPVVAPNVFTPNGDGKNDQLVFLNLWQYSESRLEIFDRWGLKIFDNSNYQNDWTGGNSPDGVYYYILKVADVKATVLHGWIEIIR